MTIGAAPIGCTVGRTISVPRGDTVSVGVSPAGGFGQFAHVKATVSRWNGSSWQPWGGLWNLPNSTAIPGSYAITGNQAFIPLSGESIGPFAAGYYQVAFSVAWYTASGSYVGARVINATGYDYQQGSSTQAWCHF
jgi:hypothetical protein